MTACSLNRVFVNLAFQIPELIFCISDSDCEEFKLKNQNSLCANQFAFAVTCKVLLILVDEIVFDFCSKPNWTLLSLVSFQILKFSTLKE